MNAIFNVNGKIIETERLILRPFKETDLDDLYEYASVEGVGEMAGWPHHTSKEGSLFVLKMFIEEDKTFAICLKDNNKVIGSLGIEKYGLEDKFSEFANLQGRELGFVLSKDYWGKGLVVEACRAIIDYLFNDLDFDFLLCGHFNTNNQSKKVQEKLGFKPYRAISFDTLFGTKEEGILNLLVNPNKDFELEFSHPESLIVDYKRR